MLRHQADLRPTLGRDQVAVSRLFAHVIEHIGKRVVLGQLACGRKLLLRGLVGRFPFRFLIDAGSDGFRIPSGFDALVGSNLPHGRFRVFRNDILAQGLPGRLHLLAHFASPAFCFAMASLTLISTRVSRRLQCSHIKHATDISSQGSFSSISASGMPQRYIQSPTRPRTASALEAHLHEHRVGNGVVDHREQAQRHLAALRLAHHALHVEALGLAGVLEVRHDGEHRFRVALHAVVQLGLVHVLRADERTIVRLVIDVTALIRLIERDFLLVRHIDTPYS